MDKTIEYYNQNADMFAQGTRLVDFTVVQERFRKMLPVGSRKISVAVLVEIRSIFLRRDIW